MFSTFPVRHCARIFHSSLSKLYRGFILYRAQMSHSPSRSRNFVSSWRHSIQSTLNHVSLSKQPQRCPRWVSLRRIHGSIWLKSSNETKKENSVNIYLKNWIKLCWRLKMNKFSIFSVAWYQFCLLSISKNVLLVDWNVQYVATPQRLTTQIMAHSFELFTQTNPIKLARIKSWRCDVVSN